MYDSGLHKRGKRAAAVFTRMNPNKIDDIVKVWRDRQWIRESFPPTTLFSNVSGALQQLEELATDYIKAWYTGLDKGYRFQEPIREMRGPARDAMRELILYWLPNFQY